MTEAVAGEAVPVTTSAWPGLRPSSRHCRARSRGTGTNAADATRSGPTHGPTRGGESSATLGRGGPGLRFPSGPIGRVEEQLWTLRGEVHRLLQILGVPARPRGPGPPHTPTGKPDSAGNAPARPRPRVAAGASPTATPVLMRSVAGFDPRQGAGGSGPQHDVSEPKPEEEPELGFGFLPSPVANSSGRQRRSRRVRADRGGPPGVLPCSTCAGATRADTPSRRTSATAASWIRPTSPTPRTAGECGASRRSSADFRGLFNHLA